jgi:hypothetical protein
MFEATLAIYLAHMDYILCYIILYRCVYKLIMWDLGNDLDGFNQPELAIYYIYIV